MSLPSKKIRKVQLPGDVGGDKTYEIVPAMLSDGTYAVELPTLSADTNFVLTSTNQNIDGNKTFTSYANFNRIRLTGSSANTGPNTLYIKNDNNVASYTVVSILDSLAGSGNNTRGISFTSQGDINVTRYDGVSTVTVLSYLKLPENKGTSTESAVIATTDDMPHIMRFI